ncbi:hypothetical protein BSKO_01377 [Bryopsis sp. KO-2023]|nr:hypothetical protein BSKO_01377 [Bryopsis sp. KO-2023]
MDSSDDDMAELARLRSQRQSRPGGTKASFYEEDDEPGPSPQVEEDSGVFPNPEDDYEHGMRAHFPATFGRKAAEGPEIMKLHENMRRGQSTKDDKTDDGGEIAPEEQNPVSSSHDEMVRPPVDDAGPSWDVMNEDEDDDDPYMLPITHEAVLKGHTKVVSALDVDRSGARIVTGSYDYGVRIYDFNGMKNDMRSFRQVEPHEGHPVLSVSFSPTGECFMAVTGATQAKIYDRDGKTLGEFIRGDMYIRDMRNTKGHVSGLCGGMWHPVDKETIMTCSDDGTIRTWDAVNIEQKVVVKPTLRKPGRVAVTACCYSRDGGIIAGGLRDGSIQLWGAKGKFGRSAAIGQVAPPKAQMIQKQTWKYVTSGNQILKDAHPADSDITSICFSRNNHTMLSRAMDHTVKVWDIRQLRSPVGVIEGLPNHHAQTRVSFSPDESLVLTGVSEDEGSPGYLAVIDIKEMKVVRKVEIGGHVVASLWHDRLNQIVVGAGDRSGGTTSVLYNPHRSEKGALLCVGRAPRKKSVMEFTAPVVIHNPHALPMFREPRSKKRQREKDLMDQVKARRPDPGMAVSGLGKGGKLGATGGTLLTQHLLRTRGKMMSVDEERDPREALLRHANKKDAFSLYTAAYKKTQPEPIFADVEEEGEEDEADKKGD